MGHIRQHLHFLSDEFGYLLSFPSVVFFKHALPVSKFVKQGVQGKTEKPEPKNQVLAELKRVKPRGHGVG